MKKVSIIVPVYNVEVYLEKCLDSLINQTLEDIEIILIDDCSTDRSVEIIKEYCNKYSNKIKAIFLTENRRQGFIRNMGMEIANGEYIAFVDSDDYIDIEMCDILYKKAKEKDYDIVCFDMINILNRKEKSNNLPYNSSIDGEIDYPKRDLLLNSKGYFSTRIYKREMLISNNIRFPEGIFYEDSPFNTLTLLYSKNIAKVDRGLYFYLQRDGSSSNCMNQERLYHRIDTLEFMFNEVKNRELYKKYKSIIDKKYLKMAVGNIHLCLDMFDKPNINKMDEISKNLQSNIVNYSDGSQYKELDKVSKLYIRINQYSPKLLVKIDKLYKSILKLLKK